MIDSFRTCHTLFLLNCELRKYYRSHGEQSNSSRMSLWSICEVPRRAGFTLSIVLGFPTSCGPTRCWLNYCKPCPRMTLQMPSKMLQPHVKNHSGMTGKAIFFLMLCPAVQRSLFCGSATQEDLADSEISDTQPRDVKVPIKQWKHWFYSQSTLCTAFMPCRFESLCFSSYY